MDNGEWRMENGEWKGFLSPWKDAGVGRIGKPGVFS